MKFSLDFSSFRGDYDISLPASKSAAIRMILLSSLCREETLIRISEMSSDILSAAECIKEMGSAVTYDGEKLRIVPSEPKKEKYVFKVGESAALLRFLMPIAGALGLRSEFVLSKTLVFRPEDEILRILNSNGCRAVKNGSVVTLDGKLRKGEYKVDVSASSQFASGLVMILPLMNGSSVTPVNKAVSEGYFNMTAEIMRCFSAFVCHKENSYYSIGGYVSPNEIVCPSDASCAAPLLMLGALNENGIKVRMPERSFSQPDICFSEILKQIGADVNSDGNMVSVSKNEINPVKIDISGSPDIFPFLAPVLALANGKSEILVPKSLKYKESDRIVSVSEMITSLGGECSYSGGVFTVYGRESLRGGSVKTFHDHRIAMAAAILSSVTEEETVIDDAECISKSFISFFDILEKSGVSVKYSED